MFWASVGNTVPAVFWIFYFVLTNSDVKKRVLEEVDTVYQTVEVSSGELPLLSQQQLDTLKVSLRLFFVSHHHHHHHRHRHHSST